MQVTLITPPTEITSDNLKQYLADCSAVVRNAQPKDNGRLFQRLLKESYGGRPSRVFEYIPCRGLTAVYFSHLLSQIQFFGFYDNAGYYYTNARELLNWGFTWEEIIPFVDFTHYRAVHVKAPYFLYGQASTHTQITSVSHSNRYTEAGLGYWMPEEITCNQIQWDKMVKQGYPPAQLETHIRSAGVTRREIYARGADMLEYRVYTIGGYMNNPNAWPHFINQRLRDPHTQKEMRELAGMIEAVL